MSKTNLNETAQEAAVLASGDFDGFVFTSGGPVVGEEASANPSSSRGGGGGWLQSSSRKGRRIQERFAAKKEPYPLKEEGEDKSAKHERQARVALLIKNEKDVRAPVKIVRAPKDNEIVMKEYTFGDVESSESDGAVLRPVKTFSKPGSVLAQINARETRVVFKDTMTGEAPALPDEARMNLRKMPLPSLTFHPRSFNEIRELIHVNIVMQDRYIWSIDVSTQRGFTKFVEWLDGVVMQAQEWAKKRLLDGASARNDVRFDVVNLLTHFLDRVDSLRISADATCLDRFRTVYRILREFEGATGTNATTTPEMEDEMRRSIAKQRGVSVETPGLADTMEDFVAPIGRVEVDEVPVVWKAVAKATNRKLEDDGVKTSVEQLTDSSGVRRLGIVVRATVEEAKNPIKAIPVFGLRSYAEVLGFEVHVRPPEDRVVEQLSPWEVIHKNVASMRIEHGEPAVDKFGYGKSIRFQAGVHWPPPVGIRKSVVDKVIAARGALAAYKGKNLILVVNQCYQFLSVVELVNRIHRRVLKELRLRADVFVINTTTRLHDPPPPHLIDYMPRGRFIKTPLGVSETPVDLYVRLFDHFLDQTDRKWACLLCACLLDSAMLDKDEYDVALGTLVKGIKGVKLARGKSVFKYISPTAAWDISGDKLVPSASVAYFQATPSMKIFLNAFDRLMFGPKVNMLVVKVQLNAGGDGESMRVVDVGDGILKQVQELMSNYGGVPGVDMIMKALSVLILSREINSLEGWLALVSLTVSSVSADVDYWVQMAASLLHAVKRCAVMTRSKWTLQAGDEAKPGDFVDKLKQKMYSSEGEVFLGTELGGSLWDLLTSFSIVGVFASSGLFGSKEAVKKHLSDINFLLRARPHGEMAAESFVERFIRFINLLVHRVWTAIEERDWSKLFQDDMTIGRWTTWVDTLIHDEIIRLDPGRPQLEVVFRTNKSMGLLPSQIYRQLGVPDRISMIHDCLGYVSQLKKRYQSEGIVQQTIKNRVDLLNNEERALTALGANSSARIVPLGYFVFGKPGVGKTRFLSELHAVLGDYLEFQCDETTMYRVDPTSNFHDTFHNGQWAVLMDDIDQSLAKESAGVMNHVQLSNKLINSAPFSMERAAVNEKGKYFANFITAYYATNFADGALDGKCKDTMQFWRRYKVRIEMLVKPEFADVNGGLHKDNAYEDGVIKEDVWLFKVRLYDGGVPMNHAFADLPYGKETVFTSKRKLFASLVKHFARQYELQKKEFAEREARKKGPLLAKCVKCRLPISEHPGEGECVDEVVELQVENTVDGATHWYVFLMTMMGWVLWLLFLSGFPSVTSFPQMRTLMGVTLGVGIEDLLSGESALSVLLNVVHYASVITVPLLIGMEVNFRYIAVRRNSQAADAIATIAQVNLQVVLVTVLSLAGGGLRGESSWQVVLARFLSNTFILAVLLDVYGYIFKTATGALNTFVSALDAFTEPVVTVDRMLRRVLRKREELTETLELQAGGDYVSPLLAACVWSYALFHAFGFVATMWTRFTAFFGIDDRMRKSAMEMYLTRLFLDRVGYGVVVWFLGPAWLNRKLEQLTAHSSYIATKAAVKKHYREIAAVVVFWKVCYPLLQQYFRSRRVERLETQALSSNNPIGLLPRKDVWTQLSPTLYTRDYSMRLKPTYTMTELCAVLRKRLYRVTGPAGSMSCLALGKGVVLAPKHLLFKQDSLEQRTCRVVTALPQGCALTFKVGTGDVRVILDPKRTILLRGRDLFLSFVPELPVFKDGTWDLMKEIPPICLAKQNNRSDESLEVHIDGVRKLPSKLVSTSDYVIPGEGGLICWEYAGEHNKGDCGAPIVGRFGDRFYLVGIHGVGRSFETGGVKMATGRGESLSLDELQEPFNLVSQGIESSMAVVLDPALIDPNSEELTFQNLPPKSSLFVSLTNVDLPLLLFGNCTNGRKFGASMKTKVKKTGMDSKKARVMCERLFEKGDWFEAPIFSGCMDVGRGRDGPVFRWVDPHTRAVESYSNVGGRQECWDLAVEDYLTGADVLPNTTGYAPFTEYSAILGIPGTVNGHFELKTSAGAPFFMNKHSCVRIDRSVSPVAVSIHPELRAGIDRILKVVDDGDIYAPVALHVLKDETVSRVKNQNHKIRVFNVMPFAFNLLLKQYVGPIVAFFRENPLFFEHAIGLNIGGVKDASMIYTHITEFPNLSAADVADFDVTASTRELLNASMCVRKLGVLLGYSAAEVKRLWGLLLSAMHVMHVNKGDFWFVNFTLASGYWITLFLNCVRNSLESRYAFFSHPASRGLSFRAHIKLVVLGDDNICSVSQVSSWYTQTYVAEVLKEIGSKRTSSVKGRELVDFETMNTATFLKRTFVIFRGTVVAKIDQKTIWRMFFYRNKSELSDNDHCCVILSTMLAESWQHGREFFEHVLSVANEVVAKMELGGEMLRFYTFEEYFVKYKAGSLVVWDPYFDGDETNYELDVKY